MSEGSYKIDINKDMRIIKIGVWGTFSKEKAETFHHDYMNTITPIETNDYCLFLDSRGMDVITTEMLPKLQISFAMYKKSSFKEIIFIIEDMEIRKQLTKILYFSGLENHSFISPGDFKEKFRDLNF